MRVDTNTADGDQQANLVGPDGTGHESPCGSKGRDWTGQVLLSHTFRTG